MERELALLPEPDLGSVEGLKSAVAELNSRMDLLAEREKKGRGPTGDEWKAVEKGFAEIAARTQALDAAVKAGAGHIGRDGDEAVAINRAAMVLEVPEDDGLKNMDRDYFNCVAFHAEELATLSLMGPRRIPGMRPAVARFLENPAHHHTLRLWDEFLRLNDALYLLDSFLCGRGRTLYAQRGGPRERMRTLRMWPEWEQIAGEVQRSLGTGTAGTGGNWVPTILSANLQDIMELQLRVLSLFPTIPMPSKNFDWPVLGARSKPYLVAEGAQTDGTGVPAVTFTSSTPTTNKVSFVAVKLGVLVHMSSEEEEDSIIPAIPFVLDDIAMALGHGLEDAVINGDTDATLDGATFNPTISPRRAWNGLRQSLEVASYPALIDMGNLAATAAKLIDLLALMGVYGVTPSDLAMITGFKGYSSLRKMAEMITLDKMGPNASIITGQVGQFEGSPVIISEKVVNLNAAGKYDGITTDRGTILTVNRRSWGHGVRRAITVAQADQYAFPADLLAFRATTRDDFKAFYPLAAATAPVGVLYNVA